MSSHPVYSKKRKLPFSGTSARPPIGIEDVYGEETDAPTPFYNPIVLPEERLYRNRQGIQAQFPNQIRAPVACVYDPKNTGNCLNSTNATLRAPPPKCAPPAMRHYLTTEYQKYLQYAEKPTVFLSDFESDRDYMQQA